MLHQIGAGVLGPVFRAYQPDPGRLVAVKQFLHVPPDAVQLFVAALERTIAADLTHLGIAAPIAVGITDGRAYLAQDFVAAESFDVIQRDYGPAPVGDILRLARQLALALDFAAAASVFHGALHPRDVLMLADEVRVTGLGVAQALEAVGVVPPVHAPYTAPERVAGLSWDRRADAFSLAALVFEMLAGRRIAGVGIDAFGGEVPELAGVEPDLLRALFAKALAENPNERFDTARVFVDVLTEVLAPGTPVTRPPAGRRRRPGDPTPAARVKAPKTPVLPLDVPMNEPEVRPAEASGPGATADLRSVVPTSADASSEPAGPNHEPATASPASGADAAADVPDDVSDDVSEDDEDVTSYEYGIRHVEPEDDEAIERLPPDFDELDARLDLAPPPPPDLAIRAQVDEEPVLSVTPASSASMASMVDLSSEPVSEVDAKIAVAPRVEDAVAGAADQEPSYGGPFARASAPTEDAGRRSGNWLLALGVVVGLLVGFAFGYAYRDRADASPTQVADAAERNTTTERPGASAASSPAISSRSSAADAPGESSGASQAPVATPATPAPASAQATTSPSAASPSASASRTPAPVSAAPPAPARPVRTGQVAVRSTPAGARVTIDGRPAGVTPMTATNLSFGTHRVRVSAQGYSTAERRVRIGTTQPAQSIEIALVATRPPRAAAPPPVPTAAAARSGGGVLVLDSRPAGARVFVDGRLVGTTPMQMDGVSAGDHAVRFELDGFGPWSSTARVAGGGRTRVSGSLEQ